MNEVVSRGVGESMVRIVWDELMPGCAYDDNLTWNEAGVDSLKSLHYLLRIEALTGQKVSFDLFGRDMKLKDLSSALFSTGPETQKGSEGQRTVFLLPGIFGDEPRLGNLRNALREEVSWETLELADLHQPGAVLADISKTAALVAGEIRKRQPDGAIILAGYSFGGLVAYQAALELETCGRHVELLCLFDTLTSAAEGKVMAEDASSGKEARETSLLERFLPKGVEKPYAYLERIVFRLSQKYGFLEFGRRIVLFSWSRYSLAKGQERRRDLLWAFRIRAMRQWKPRACSVRTLLIASDDCISGESHLAWGRLCSILEVSYVGGDHWGIFDPGPMAALVPALRSALGLHNFSANKAERATSRHVVQSFGREPSIDLLR